MENQISLKNLRQKRDNNPTTFNVKNFVRIAYNKLYPDLTTVEGLKQHLVTWYCFTYGVTEKDDKLQEMTLEELVVLYQMHRIKENPEYYQEIMDPENSYEKWLKEQMGEDYVTEEENVQQILEHEKELERKAKEEYPSEVTTDFSQFQEED